ncbi:MAG: hypothetical protein GY757_56645 [bacterium]|nr:hypothetical protein [bacterium]
MKTTKRNIKLSLKKMTVADLNSNDMNNAKGGILPTGPICIETRFICPHTVNASLCMPDC